MPTGYTAPIADGITFKEYAMGCARAFGALVMMRDEPQSAEIPEAFEASSYHKERIEKDAIELKELLALSPEVAAEKAKAAHEKHLAYHAEEILKDEALAEKYKTMLAEVEAYQSPSPDHDNFKKFMADQIRESIKFDCGTSYHREAIDAAKLLTGPEWIASEKKRLEDSMEYHRRGHQEDLDRNNARNEWVKKLRDSLSA